MHGEHVRHGHLKTVFGHFKHIRKKEGKMLPGGLEPPTFAFLQHPRRLTPTLLISTTLEPTVLPELDDETEIKPDLYFVTC